MTTYAETRIANPSPYFELPEEVLIDEKLNHEEKVKVLRSMALDSDQMLDATAEGMAVGTLAYNAKDLQSALIQLDEIKGAVTVKGQRLTKARFQRIVVVTTVNQELNREIADVAYDMAKMDGGKVCLLNVVPSDFVGGDLATAGPMGASVSLLAADNTQMLEDRREQLLKLSIECATSIETEIEVCSGQIENVIVGYADEYNADLIVVGSANRSWLEALFDTSNARKVTRSSPCPVLVVPESS